jgi:hypothetical protein
MEAIIDFKLFLLRLCQRLLSPEPSCAHAELVFDEINDVYCKHCRKDFTG